MAEKENNPELEEVIPETGDEDMIDQACDQQQKPIEKAGAAKLAEKEAANSGSETKQEPKMTHKPSIDDLIADVHSEPEKPKIEIPAELLPKKKVWTPDQGVSKKESAAVKPILVDGLTPTMKVQQSEADEPFTPTAQKSKLPAGFVSGPNPVQINVDPQPFIFQLTQSPANPVPELNHFKLLKVYATPIQKAQALIGVEKLHPEYLYLWFDCFDGHAGNTTVGTIRVYMVRAYDEFACKDIKPNKMIDLPKDIFHVILTAASAPQMDNLEFLEDYMPIKIKG